MAKGEKFIDLTGIDIGSTDRGLDIKNYDSRYDGENDLIKHLKNMRIAKSSKSRH